MKRKINRHPIAQWPQSIQISAFSFKILRAYQKEHPPMATIVEDAKRKNNKNYIKQHPQNTQILAFSFKVQRTYQNEHHLPIIKEDKRYGQININ